MCISLAAWTAHVAVTLADRRWGLLHHGANVKHRQDRGGKLLEVPCGWLSGAGDGLVLRHLQDHRAELHAPAAVRDTLLEAYRSIEAEHPDYTLQRSTAVNLVYATEDGVDAVGLVTDGALVQPIPGGLFSWPPELPSEEAHDARRRLVGDLEGQTDALGIVAALAGACAAAETTARHRRGKGASLSREIEVGVLWWRGGKHERFRIAGDAGRIAAGAGLDELRTEAVA